MGFISEFREFAVKGNVVDMAVGIIIGAAFNKIVNSLVNDVIMPPIGMMLGGAEFSDLAWILKEGTVDESGKMAGEVAIRYGAFVNTVIEFLIIGLTVFVVVKIMNRVLRRREKAEKEAK